MQSITLLNGAAKSGQTGLIFNSNESMGNFGTASILTVVNENCDQ